MDNHVELVQDVLLVTTGGNPGMHDYSVQAGVNELILTDPASGTVTYQYGSVGGAFQNLANWWVTYTILSVQVTVTLYSYQGTGITASPFIAATEAAELDTQVPQTYQEFAQTGRMTVSASLTGTISRSQNFQKYVRENLPNPYLNTMTANTSTRDTYQPLYGASPVVQIAWQLEIPTNIQVPKFVAVVTTNTKYHFRGRRTYYPGLQKNLLPSQVALPEIEDLADQEPKGQPQTVLPLPLVGMIQTPLSKETEEQALLRKLAALRSSAVACANGA